MWGAVEWRLSGGQPQVTATAPTIMRCDLGGKQNKVAGDRESLRSK
jgi:hypothetical protein